MGQGDLSTTIERKHPRHPCPPPKVIYTNPSGAARQAKFEDRMKKITIETILRINELQLNEISNCCGRFIFLKSKAK